MYNLLYNILQYFQDRFVLREISNLMVTCPFSEAGCNWEGRFEEYQQHKDSCNLATASCEYCGEWMPRNQLYAHHELCSHVPKHCPLAQFGCTKLKMTQDKLQEHMQEEIYEHLMIMAESLRSLGDKVDLREKEQLNSTARGNDKSQQQYLPHSSEWDPDVVEIDGAHTPSIHHGARKVQSLQPRSKTQFVACLQEIESSETVDLRFDKVMLAEIESLLTKMVGESQEEIVRNLMMELRSKEMEIAELKSSVVKLEKTIRSKNADNEDRDFRLSLIENSNHDGTMIWKIPQFNQRKADAENGKYTSIFSLPFYSGRYGYKMCLRLYIMGDGIGKGTHLSLFFVVMRGEFDNILQWPFTHKVTFKLINQAGGRDIVDTFQPDPLSSSFRKPKSDMNIASGSPRFVSHTELERGGFVVDDTIFVKCSIDVSTIRYP